jgi:hypothetical protein
MSNAITSSTFHTRYSKCYYYKEKNNYIKYIDIFFNKILKKYACSSDLFLDLFSSNFNSMVRTGDKFVYKADREAYKTTCIKCAINMDIFLCNHKVTHILEEVKYKDKIKCCVGGVIKDKLTNVHFCHRPIKEMEKDLDFYLLNNYIYNTINYFKNDCLVFNTQDNMFILVRYGEVDYTIRRGFLKSIINSKNKIQGEYCKTCQESCKPLFINGLDRLNSII